MIIDVRVISTYSFSRSASSRQGFVPATPLRFPLGLWWSYSKCFSHCFFNLRIKLAEKRGGLCRYWWCSVNAGPLLMLNRWNASHASV